MDDSKQGWKQSLQGFLFWKAFFCKKMGIFDADIKQTSPITSQTTQERKKKGLKKRNSLTTTFIKASGVEISDLLHNNMIPVPKKLAQKIEIDPIKDTYLMNEYRYIRKHWVEIVNKSLMIYLERYNEKSRNNAFLTSICCDFKKLEDACDDWIRSNP